MGTCPCCSSKNKVSSENEKNQIKPVKNDYELIKNAKNSGNTNKNGTDNDLSDDENPDTKNKKAAQISVKPDSKSQMDIIELRAHIEHAKNNMNINKFLHKMENLQKDKLRKQELRKFIKRLKASLDKHEKGIYEKSLNHMKKQFDESIARGETDKNKLMSSFADQIQELVQVELNKDIKKREESENKRIKDLEEKQAQYEEEIKSLRTSANFGVINLDSKKASKFNQRYNSEIVGAENVNESTNNETVTKSIGFQPDFSNNQQQSEYDQKTINKLKEQARKKLINEELSTIKKDLKIYKENQKVMQSSLKDQYSSLQEVVDYQRDVVQKKSEEYKLKIKLAILKLKAELNTYMDQNSLTTGALYKIFDKNGDGKLSKMEFGNAIIDDLKLNYPNTEELDLIYDYMNKDNSEFQDLIEFFKLIDFEVSQDQAENREIGTDYTNTSVMSEFIQKVKDYISTHNLSMFNLYTVIDKDNNGTIDKQELASLANDQFDCKYDPRMIEIIFNELDTDNSQNINVKEFVELINLENHYNFLNNGNKVKEMLNLRVLNYLYRYFVDNDLTIDWLLQEIDADKSNEIDIFELAIYLRNKNKGSGNYYYDDLEIEQFLNFIDKDNSGSISKEELSKIIRIYADVINKDRQINNDTLDKLQAKLFPFLQKNGETLLDHFRQNEINVGHLNQSQNLTSQNVTESTGMIKVQKFKDIIDSYREFTQEELENVINPVCTPYTKKYEILQYKHFVDQKQTYDVEKAMRRNGQLDLTTEALFNKIFGLLKKVQSNLSKTKEGMFRAFDINRDEYITIQELRNVQGLMDFSISNNKWQDLLEYMGKQNNDAIINQEEFTNYINRGNQSKSYQF